MPDEALSAKVNNDINSIEDRGLENLSLWSPCSLSGIMRGAANQAYDGVASG
jgi:hypothetical protein